MSYIDKVIHALVQREGGYVNKASDRGGPTKYGITQKTLALWRKKKVSIQDVKDLTIEEAKEIYRAWYVERLGYLRFNDEPLAEQLIDAGVHHSCDRAIKLIQAAVGAREDGILGPDTLARAAKISKGDLFIKFMGHRLDYFAFCLKHPSQYEYAEGWLNRMIEMTRIYLTSAELSPGQKAFIVDAMGVMKQTSIILHRESNWPLSRDLYLKVSRVFLAGRV